MYHDQCTWDGNGADVGQAGLDSRWVGQLSLVKLHRSSLAQSTVAEMCPRDRQEHWEVIVPTGGQIDVMTHTHERIDLSRQLLGTTT